jgi:hypothetical protein
LTSRQRRRQKERIKKLEKEEELEKEKARLEMEKEENEDQKIDQVKRGGKGILDQILVSIPLGKLGPEERKHLHTMYDKEMEDIGREKTLQAIELGEHYSREMRDKSLTNNEATKISSNQIQPNNHKGFGKASDLKDVNIGKSSPASASSSSKSSSSSGKTAHKQQKKKPLDHRKEIQEIFNQLHEEKISQIFSFAEINAWVKSEDVEYLLQTIEHFHDKLYTYWSLSYQVHHGSKHEDVATALAKMALYQLKGLSNKEVDSNIYETTVKSLKRAVIMLVKIWMDPDTREEIISRRYENENYRFTNWMMSLDELMEGLRCDSISKEGSFEFFSLFMRKKHFFGVILLVECYHLYIY